MRAAKPFQAVTAIRDRAFAIMPDRPGDGYRVLMRAEACSACVPVALKHPRVRELRATMKGVAR